jgi:transposase InsO family protein
MFIDEHREEYGVEPICRVLPIAPSTYRVHAARLADRSLRSDRAKRDAELRSVIERVWKANYEVYGVRKVWRQLNREGVAVARCTVARLMAEMGLAGAVRGKPVKTTASNPATPCPEDRVNRQFNAPRPNALWLSDFTYVATWAGFVYVALVIDAFARRIVGWRVSRSMQAGFVLDALEQALHARRPTQGNGLIHHSDRGSQYVSIKYTERLADAGIEPSVGSVGDSYDNALAETVIGLFKTEVIHRRGPWRTLEDVEFATLEWVDWFNNRRLLEPIGNIPPAEAEAHYYAQIDQLAMVA